jgi:GNAT superfamily N-acetyltransferase
MSFYRKVSDSITIVNTKPEHGDGVNETIRSAFFVEDDDICDACMDEEAILQQLKRFPEGQFVALYKETTVVGIAATMRTSYPPTAEPRDWMTAIGALGIPNHEADGDWLYGVEMAVHRGYQGQGIGSALYHVRFDLVKRLSLKGWYAAGMLMGYHRYADEMTVKEYGEKVMRREMIDPTVTMQMNRGFEAWRVVENYLNEPPAGDAAVLIVWKNPEFRDE